MKGIAVVLVKPEKSLHNVLGAAGGFGNEIDIIDIQNPGNFHESIFFGDTITGFILCYANISVPFFISKFQAEFPLCQSPKCADSLNSFSQYHNPVSFLKNYMDSNKHTGMTAAHVNARLLTNIYRAFVRLFPFPFITAPIEKQTPRAALTSVVYAFI